MIPQQQPQPSPPEVSPIWILIGAVTVVLLIVALATGGTGGSSSDSASKGAMPARESLACTHFQNIRGDIDAGILTDAELRAKISEVRDSATSPAVSIAATHLLAGITLHDRKGMLAGYAELVKACK